MQKSALQFEKTLMLGKIEGGTDIVKCKAKLSFKNNLKFDEKGMKTVRSAWTAPGSSAALCGARSANEFNK